MTAQLIVGLSSWIMADGVYQDFHRGKVAAFALDFYPPDGLKQIDPADDPRPSLAHIDGPYYEVSGRCMHIDIDGGQSWWAIDVGIRLFRHERPPEAVQLGSWWQGKIYLGVDTSFYMDRGSRHHEAPALIYDWKIDKIEIQSGGKQGTEIAQTNLGRTPDCLLHCTLQDGPPRR
jgi:hypothetical protein